MIGFSVFPYLSLSLSEYFWKVQIRVESTVCALWGVGVVCSARGMCGEVVFFSPVSAVLLENEPAANSQVVIWSLVTVLPLLPWTTAPRGRDDGLLLINHEPLFLCTDSGLTGNSFWFQVTVWKTKFFSISFTAGAHQLLITKCCLWAFICYLKKFEGTLSPRKVSVRWCGCLCWSKWAWSSWCLELLFCGNTKKSE